jgi:hypothetical protein
VRDTLSRGWNLLVRGTLFLPFHDTQCGVKFLRRSAYVRVRDTARQFRDWAFDVGLLVLLYRAQRSITEVPVAWSEEEGSKFNVIRDAPRMFRSLVGIRLMSAATPDGPPHPSTGYTVDAFGMSFPPAPNLPRSSVPTVSRTGGNPEKLLAAPFAPETRWNEPSSEP